MKEESGKKRGSGKENGVTARGRRSERERGRGKGSGSGSENGRETETKTATAGPEKGSESGSETGRRIEAATGAQTAVDQGQVYLYSKKIYIYQSQK